MLKKLMSFLFEEEEEEVYTDDEFEEAIFKDVVKPKQVAKPKEISQPKVEPPVFAQPKPERMVSQTAPLKEESRKFTSIDLEPKKTKVVEPISHHRSIMADGPTSSRNEKAKNDFNVAPVISPIFGSPNQDEKDVHETTVATGIIKKNKSIGVISPIYGMNEPVSETKNTETPKKRHAAIPEEPKEELEPLDCPNIPLADILKKDEDVEDDSMQISLFGEDAPIHEDTSDYKIEE